VPYQELNEVLELKKEFDPSEEHARSPDEAYEM
jgi:hypothetical protein